MKLLLDANLSRYLAAMLAETLPGSEHVSVLGSNPSDDAIWSSAKTNGLTIVSKDSDFYRMSVTRGAPPKVVWLRIGNGSTSAVEAILRARAYQVETFISDPQSTLLIIGGS